jgi:hypothetical protein
MRTRNALERLGAAAPAEPLLDAGEEDRILGRIVGSERHPARVHRRRLMLALAGIAVLAAAAIAASLDVGHGAHHANVVKPKRGGHVILSGARIEAAGFHFKTPAGFKSSNTSCSATSSEGKPSTVGNGFAAAASADGGCVAAYFLIAGAPASHTPNPPPGDAVDVGSYHGYYDAQSDTDAALYVELPKADPAASGPVYLVLFSHGLTEDQLIAVAQSGLPASP